MNMGRKTQYHIDLDELHRLYVDEGWSTVQIAKQYDIYFADGKPNAPAVQRMLDRANISQRNKSVAQKMALEMGTAQHPTEGRERTVQERVKIGASISEGYKELTDAQKKKRTRGLRDFWNDKDKTEEQIETRRKIGAKLKLTTLEGTLLEKAIANHLTGLGYTVDIHVKECFGNTNLEADIIVSGGKKGHKISAIIEIDGPRHYDATFMNKGIAKLAETITADNKKNGMVLNMSGVWMIRILYDFGGEVTYIRATLEKIHQIFEYIKEKSKEGNVKPQDRLITLDMGLVLRGKSCRDNDGYRKAVKMLSK